MSKESEEFKIHSIKYNALMNIILKISYVIFPLITFPYATRVLKATAYGRVNFAISVVSYFALVASLGIPAYGIRKCAEVRDDREKLSKTVKELLILNSISLVLTYIAFVICVFVIQKFREDSTLLFICSITIILQTFGVDWFYEAIEQYDYITVRNIVFKIISMIMLFTFVHSPKDYIAYCIVNIIGTVGSNILNILRLPKYVELKDNYKLNFKIHLLPVFTLFFYYAATTIYTNLDTIMLGFMKSSGSVGYYNAAVKIKNLLVSLITAVGAVALPRISYYLHNNEKDKFRNVISTSFNYVLYISFPLAIFCSVKAKSIILFLAGNGYVGAISAMKVITPSVLFIGFTSVTAYQMLIPLKRDVYTLFGAVAGALVDFILNMIFIPKYGATGAAFGTLVAEFVVLIIHVFALKDIIASVINIIELLKILSSTVIASLFIFILNYFFIGKSPFVDCLISGVLFSVSYFILCYLLNVTAERNILIILKRNILKIE